MTPDSRSFDVSLDGQCCVTIKRTAATEAPRLIVVEHWFEELKQRVPVK